MIIDWLKKKESPRELFAIEKISLIYNALTVLIIVCLFMRIEHPVRMLIEHVCIAVATILLIFLHQKYPSRTTTFVRIAVQLALLAYWYPETFEFNRLFPNLDCYFAATEQTIFHCQPSVEFSKACPSMWFSEPFNLGYFSYYWLIFIVVLYYFIFQFRHFERVAFIIIASFFLYYLIYIFVPVAGPQFYFPAIGMDNVTAQNFLPLGDYFNHNNILLPAPGYNHGLFYNLVEASQEVGERPTAAFPSSHVGISTIIIILAYKARRWFGAVILPFYVLLCGATVYIQAHYLIDVFGGWITAVAFYFITDWLYRRWFS